MKRIALAILLSVMPLTFPGNAQGQVYAQGVTGGPMIQLLVVEFSFTQGSSAKTYGVVQYRSRLGIDDSWIRWTTLTWGSRSFTVRTQWIAALSILSLLSLSIFGSLWRRVQLTTLKTYYPTNASNKSIDRTETATALTKSSQ